MVDPISETYGAPVSLRIVAIFATELQLSMEPKNVKLTVLEGMGRKRNNMRPVTDDCTTDISHKREREMDLKDRCSDMEFYGEIRQIPCSIARL